MAVRTYWGKRGELRIYSATDDGGGGMYYFKVAFVNMNFSAPEGRPRPENIPVTDRGIYNENAHYIQGTDEVIMAPLNVTWTCNLDNMVNRDDLRKALSNPERGTWTVGSQTFTNTNGTTALINGFGSSITTALPFDPEHDRVDVAVLWQGDTPGTDDTGRIYREVWFAPEQVVLRESETAVEMSVTGYCYGPVSSISAFPGGTPA